MLKKKVERKRLKEREKKRHYRRCTLLLFFGLSIKFLVLLVQRVSEALAVLLERPFWDVLVETNSYIWRQDSCWIIHRIGVGSGNFFLLFGAHPFKTYHVQYLSSAATKCMQTLLWTTGTTIIKPRSFQYHFTWKKHELSCCCWHMTRQKAEQQYEIITVIFNTNVLNWDFRR